MTGVGAALGVTIIANVAPAFIVIITIFLVLAGVITYSTEVLLA